MSIDNRNDASGQTFKAGGVESGPTPETTLGPITQEMFLTIKAGDTVVFRFHLE